MRKPEEDGLAERLMQAIYDEHVELTEFRDEHVAAAQMGTFPDELRVQEPLREPL